MNLGIRMVKVHCVRSRGQFRKFSRDRARGKRLNPFASLVSEDRKKIKKEFPDVWGKALLIHAPPPFSSLVISSVSPSSCSSFPFSPSLSNFCEDLISRFQFSPEKATVALVARAIHPISSSRSHESRIVSYIFSLFFVFFFSFYRGMIVIWRLETVVICLIIWSDLVGSGVIYSKPFLKFYIFSWKIVS